MFVYKKSIPEPNKAIKADLLKMLMLLKNVLRSGLKSDFLKSKENPYTLSTLKLHCNIINSHNLKTIIYRKYLDKYKKPI